MKPNNLVSHLTADRNRSVSSTLVNIAKNAESGEYRSYFTKRDRAYFRESTRPAGGKKTAAHFMRDHRDEYIGDEFEIPTVFSRVDSGRAGLNSIFLSSFPVFKTIAPPELLQIQEQYDAVIEADSEKFGWVHQLSMCHLDALKYDICCAEVDWTVLSVPKTIRDEESGQLSISYQQVYAGNSITRIHPANAFWDCSVPIYEVHTKGDYAGYTELYSLQRLLGLLHSLEYTEEEINKLIFPTEAQKRAANFYSVIDNKISLYEKPTISREVPDVSPEDSAAHFDIPDDAIADKFSAEKKAITQGYEVTKIYLRTIPAVLGLSSKDVGATIPRLYLVILLNGVHTISIEELSHDHNYLPMVFSSLLNDSVGQTSKSFSHNLESLQVVANKLITLDIQSARRAISDRAIYNPHIIDPAHVNNPSATAKIPLKKSSPSADVRAAYLPVPYQDSALGTRTQQAMAVMSFADEISGQNPVTQGQFIRGNKTNQQFQESMSASEARKISMALGLAATFYFPIKEIIKFNIAQYQTSEETYSRSMEKKVTINAQELKSFLPEFQLADGLLTAARRLSSEVLTIAMQNFANFPELSVEYNINKMMIDLLSTSEGMKLDRYRRSTEEIQQIQQQQMAMAQARQEPEGEQPPAQQPGMMARLFGGG